MKFSGPLLDRSIQFPEDVGAMRGWLKGLGFQVGDRDCQALWVKLSREHYPFDKAPGDYAWLNVGVMSSIFGEHATKYLVPVDACHADR